MTYIPTVTDLSDIRERAALGIGHLSVTDVVVLCAEVERLREAVAEEREACAHIASSRAIPILVENITTAGVSRELDIAVQIAAAIRATLRRER